MMTTDRDRELNHIRTAMSLREIPADVVTKIEAVLAVADADTLRGVNSLIRENFDKVSEVQS